MLFHIPFFSALILSIYRCKLLATTLTTACLFCKFSTTLLRYKTWGLLTCPHPYKKINYLKLVNPFCTVSIYINAFPLDTERKLNIHKTWRRCPGHFLDVLCNFNLYIMSRVSIFYNKCSKILKWIRIIASIRTKSPSWHSCRQISKSSEFSINTLGQGAKCCQSQQEGQQSDMVITQFWSAL